MQIHEMLAEERPRERLWNGGTAGLRTSELIAILLRTGLQGKSAIALGEELLQRYRSLNELCQASAQELSRVKGLGMAKAVQLKAAFELGARLAASQRREQPMDDPEAVYALLSEEMRALPYESLRVLALNSRYHLIAMREVSRGTLDETTGHPRDVFRTAMEYNAHGIVIAHNHPSGDPAPSEADWRFTQQLKEASKFLEIRLLDHIILGIPSADCPKGFYSFEQEGYL